MCAGEDGLRLIGNQGTLGGIEGLCFEMGLLIKCCPQTAVSRGVLQFLFCLSFSKSEGFFLFFFEGRNESRRFNAAADTLHCYRANDMTISRILTSACFND